MEENNNSQYITYTEPHAAAPEPPVETHPQGEPRSETQSTGTYGAYQYSNDRYVSDNYSYANAGGQTYYNPYSKQGSINGILE